MPELLDEYRAFLASSLPEDYDAHPARYRDDKTLRTEFQAASFDEGWLVPEWPRDLGGRALSLLDSVTVRIEGARRRVPRQMNIQGAGVAAPAIKALGTAQQREAFLRPTLRGEAWWALGMSEPEAGSDLASLRTSAVSVEGGYRVNGQKVWTTQADEARWCSLYVRTDPELPRHRGISCLLVDMDSEGIDVRPIRTADPSIESFCEVFFDDVFVPSDRLLGERGGGWAVAMQSLEHERDMIWINNWLELQRAIAPVLQSTSIEPFDLESVGRILADMEGIRLSGLRSVANRSLGINDSLAGILKLSGSEAVQAAAAFACEFGASDGTPQHDQFTEYLESMAATIYGGTSEIQRNIIAERILGLPKGAPR